MFGFGKRKARLAVRSVSTSAVGMVRDNNEDHILVDESHSVFCVADGMGGGADGEQASEIVCAEVAMMLRLQPEEFAARMEAACNAIVCANAAIWDYSQSMGFNQMGTTVSMILFDPADFTRAVIGHVGDSRIYRFRKNAVRQLTRDHSVGAELGRKCGMSSRLGARSNPLAHVLTRAIGTGQTVSPDWRKIQVEAGDRYLLCTDGVHDVVEAARLNELVGRGTLAEARRALEQEVIKCGAPDNFSFIILDVEAQCS